MCCIINVWNLLLWDSSQTFQSKLDIMCLEVAHEAALIIKNLERLLLVLRPQGINLSWIGFRKKYPTLSIL